MKKVLTVFGTRPEAIKMAPVVEALQKNSDKFDSRVCVTAQHRELLDQVVGVFHLPVHVDLDLMRVNQGLQDLMNRGMESIDRVLSQEAPDVVLVHGDTTTAFFAALAAFYRGIPVGHVEAGLRTYDSWNPFPEEANRRFVDVVSQWWFAPTQRARENLLAEGAKDDRIFVTGNTIVDALHRILEVQKREGMDKEYQSRFEVLTGVPLDGRLILVTGHRRESFGPAFEHICSAIRRVAEANREVRFIYPVHPNPNVQGPAHALLGGLDNVHLVPPVEYGFFVWLLKHAYLVLTDSGGIQEEAPSLGVPVLITREVTERPEAVEAGVARLVGTDAQKISAELQRLLDYPDEYKRMRLEQNPFGDGRAAERIVQALLDAD